MKRMIIIDIAITLALSLLSFLVLSSLAGRAATVGTTTIGGLAYAVVLPMCVTAPITVWSILTSLKDFKAESRHAYYIICGGIFLIALAQIEQIVMALTMVFLPSLPESMGVTIVSLLFLVPFGGSLIALYVGVRKLARILNIKTIWCSGVLVFVFSLLTSGFYIITPLTGPEMVLIAQITYFLGGLTFAATIVTYRISYTISSAYRVAMRWMVAGLAILTISLAQEILLKCTALAETAYTSMAMDLLPFMVSVFLFMQAGRAFKLATFRRLPTTATFIDAVIYTAELASNRVAIDPILDDLRKTTAQIQGNSDPDKDSKEAILRVYLRLEAYLVKEESMRNFTVVSLRERLPNEFQEAVAQLRRRVA